MLRTSRGWHQRADAAKTSRNGARTGRKQKDARRYSRRKSLKKDYSDEEAEAAAAQAAGDARAKADERKLQAYVAAANGAAKAAAEHAATERRDADGSLTDELERTQRRKAESDARMTEWPDLLEVSLLGGLGCGGQLLAASLKRATERTYRRTRFSAGAKDDDAGRASDDDDGGDSNKQKPPRYVALQATETAVPFYERHGFSRVGALAK